MIIGVDAGCLGIKDSRLKVGVYQMAKSLFEELSKLDANNKYLLYSFYPIDKKLLKSFGKNVKNIVVKPVRGWTKIWLPLQLLRDRPDVFVGLNQSLPTKLPTQTYKSIVIVHDLLFEEDPKLYPGSFRKLHKESKFASENADRIIVPSLSTKKDLENFYKISEVKITIIPEGIRKFPKVNNYKLLATDYFLFVGALKPQKNIPTLLKAFAQMVNSQWSIVNRKNPHPNLLPGKQGEGDQGIDLLIVGGDKWKDREIDKSFRKLSKDTQNRIKFLGNVGEAELAKLYKNALAFVSPSLSEGFGLTFLEAMSFGTPVIGPDRGAVLEVVGNGGILTDPTDEEALVKAMEKMLNAKARAIYSKKALLQSRKFSWKSFASKFLQTIETYS